MNDETCEKWRIVGVFNNVEDDKYDKDSRVKIIKDQAIGTYSWDTNPGFNQWGESTYVGGTQYEGSDLMRELNTDYLGNITVGIDAKWYAGTGSTRTASMPRSLINSTYEKMIQSVNWSVGATPAGTDTNVSLASIRVGSMYSNERSINYGYEYNGSGERKDTVNRTTTWIGKVGLPYVSDYAYSVKSEACLKDIGLSVYRSTSGACAGSWMNTDTSDKWTLSIFGSNVENSKVLSLGNRINADNSTSANSVYPTLYLKNDVRVIGGDGSAAYPYKLKR